MNGDKQVARDTLFGAALFIAVWLFAAVGLPLLAPQAAHAQPYGGCDEAWQAPRSEGADQCRAHGWTVTRHIVVGPKQWVRAINNLPHCDNEDGGVNLPCSWNFPDGTTDGNGTGSIYWLDRHGKQHFVRGIR